MYRGKLNLLFNLKTCYLLLQNMFTNIKLTTTLPFQIVIRIESCTLLLFSSGQFRIMGRVSDPNSILACIDFIYSDIHTPIQLVSQTLAFIISYSSINLHSTKRILSHDPNILFEPELFCALCLNHWKPVHVNVFSTGKVVILGKYSMKYADEISKWIQCNILSIQ